MANAGDVIGIIQIYSGSTLIDCTPGSKIRLPGRKNTAVPTGYKTRTAASYQGGQVDAPALMGTGDDLDCADPSARGALQVSCDTLPVSAVPDHSM